MVTSTDVISNRDHRGPCLACSAGKHRDHSHPSRPVQPPTAPGEELHLDIHDLPCLSLGGSTSSVIIFDSSTKTLSISGTKTKTLRDVFKAILQVIFSYYNAHKHRVHRIYCDSESVLAALRAPLDCQIPSTMLVSLNVSIRLLLRKLAQSRQHFPTCFLNPSISNYFLTRATYSTPYLIPQIRCLLPTSFELDLPIFHLKESSASSTLFLLPTTNANLLLPKLPYPTNLPTKLSQVFM